MSDIREVLKYHVTGAIERGESEAIVAQELGTSDVMRWYVLNPRGKTVTDVIVDGPYTSYRELEAEHDIWGGMYETALLNSNKVRYHLEQDAKLLEWLKDRAMHNPFQ